MLFLDAGALLFARTRLSDSQKEQKILTAEGIARATAAMHCTAVGIGPQDLAGGLDLLKKIQADNQLPLLSLNLVDKNSGKTLFPPYLITKAGSTTIGVIGLTDHHTTQPATPSLAVLPWRDVLQQTVEKLSPVTDMIILLSSYPSTINQIIAQTLPGISLLLESGQSTASKTPLQINKTLITHVAARGKYLGMMRITWNESHTWGQDLDLQIRENTKRLENLNALIQKRKNSMRVVHPASDEKMNNLVTARSGIEDRIARLHNRQKSTTSPPCRYTNHFIALKSSLPKDPEVKTIIAQTNQQIHIFNHNQTWKNPGRTSPSLVQLAGSKRCAQCHPAQAAFWETTGHSQAWETLQLDNQHFNNDCLYCHVTLPTYKKDEVLSQQLLHKFPTKLRGVGCESCHGPAADHSRKPQLFHALFPQEKTCRQCHQGDHNATFNYLEKLNDIRCPKPKH